ncbi:MAG: response regulator transcription factor [Dehalococcoidales bacterium]|nr:response regulator transcription factor [Dehalococcoidales bacterium]
MTEYTILVVEDDRNLLDTIEYNLKRENYRVVKTMNGSESVTLARTEKPDLVLLDIMLPGLDGLEVCRILRKDMTVPIMLLTARSEEVDKIIGLEMGADDYLTKPFSMRELIARIRAIFRRAEMGRTVSDEGTIIVTGDMRIDTGKHVVTIRGNEVTMSPREYELLMFLALNKGMVFTREQLLDKVWGYDYTGDARTVDVHIRWLRQKIETDPSNPAILLTVRGAGYKTAG